MTKLKRTTKQAGDSKSKRRPMPSDSVELARSLSDLPQCVTLTY